MASFNLFGDTQREQWHTVVKIMRQYAGQMETDDARKGFLGLCDEIDRYIDWAENTIETLKGVKV